MKYSTDKCIACGSHARPYALKMPECNNLYHLSSDGSLANTDYWFCSIDCYKREVRKYLDKRLDFDVHDHFTPEEIAHWAQQYRCNHMPDKWGGLFTSSARQQELFDEGVKDFCDTYTDAQGDAIDRAVNEIIRRIYAEADYEAQQEQEKMAEKERLEEERMTERQQREHERQQAADERRREQERRESQREAERAERQAEREAREQERREERERREREKWDAEERKREELEAEEAKWRPRKFEI
jgi:hypothetical protein